MMNKKFQKYLHLSRILKPTGFLLLWIPCLWGLSIQKLSISSLLIESLLFLIGSVSLRTFGCIINDICDKDFDAKVKRTKNRPLASGILSVKQAFVFSFFCLIPGFMVFLYLPFENKKVAFFGFCVSLAYPFFKRFTHFPQLILGFSFNIGILVSAFGRVELSKIIWIYIGGIFWTLAYDTIYAFQDEKDDVIVGIKSTAVYFKDHPKRTVLLFYFLSLASFLVALNKEFSIMLIALFMMMGSYLTIQVKAWDHNDPKSCFSFFRKNVFIGFALTVIFYLISSL